MERSKPRDYTAAYSEAWQPEYKCHSKSAAGRPMRPNLHSPSGRSSLTRSFRIKEVKQRDDLRCFSDLDLTLYLLEVEIFFRWQQFEFFPFFLWSAQQQVIKHVVVPGKQWNTCNTRCVIQATYKTVRSFLHTDLKTPMEIVFLTGSWV